MGIFVDFIDHFLPIAITVILFVIALAMRIGSPYCRYVALVADTDNEQGKENLARYLARTTGGRKIDVDKAWRSFIPAARELQRTHLRRRIALTQ